VAAPVGTRVVPSPCVNICRIDAVGRCEGCRRTLDEIASWMTRSAAERGAIMRDLPGRRG